MIKRIGLLVTFFGVVLMGGSVSAETQSTQQPPSQGAIIEVGNGLVDNGLDGTCSLREALFNAQRDTSAGQANDCTHGIPGQENTVLLASNGTYQFDSTQLPFDITRQVRLDGNGATLTHAASGFFDVTATGTFVVDNVTLQDSVGSRTAIESAGTLRIYDSVLQNNQNTATSGGAIEIDWDTDGESAEFNNVTFHNNYAAGNGGALNIEFTGTGLEADVTLNNVVFSDNGQNSVGDLTARGGAMHVQNSVNNEPLRVTIENSQLTGNQAQSGGGINANDLVELVIVESTLDANESFFSGGGIQMSGARLDMFRSTVSNNVAGVDGDVNTAHGGGIANTDGSVALNNSTLSSNQADAGGGFRNIATVLATQPATVVLFHTTITGNEAWGNSAGGGFSNRQLGTEAATVFVRHSLVLGNVAANSNFDCRNSDGTVSSLGYNLKSGSALAGCTFDKESDVTVLGPASDTLFKSLADNGGPTKTHALTFGSAARNAIPATASTCLSGLLDQRGFFRTTGNATTACDIGAYEWGATAPPTAVVVLGGGSAEIPPLTHIAIFTLLLAVCTIMFGRGISQKRS